jgi:succinate-acetate transporter protein
MPIGNESLKLTDTTANPAPLGLLGFGMTTVLLNFHNAGFYKLDSTILAMGLFYGGMAQVIAGIMEWKKNNTFGMTAFISYGFFWMTLVALLTLPKLTFLGWEGPSPASLTAYLTIWGLFTLVMFVGTLRLNRALQFVFGTLTLLFFLLAAGHGIGSEEIEVVAGYIGIICGFSAVYTGLAQVLNEVYGRVICPLGPVKK